MKVEYRLYKCTVCGHTTKISTNHEGPCLACCTECSWKSIGYGPGVHLFGVWHRAHTFVGESQPAKEAP